MSCTVSDVAALETAACADYYYYFFLQIKLMCPNEKENVVSRYLQLILVGQSSEYYLSKRC